jgi:hypothetical protein
VLQDRGTGQTYGLPIGPGREAYLDRSICRRVVLDSLIDGRGNREGYETSEEAYDVY